MAKEKNSTRALTGVRLMHKDIPSTLCLAQGGTFVLTNGWQNLNDDVIYYETTFDLSAYELDDLTVVPTSLSLQDGLPYTTVQPGPDTQLAVLDIISQESLDIQAVYDNYTTTYDIPGSPASLEDWTQLLMCNFRLMTPQTDFQNSSLLLSATGGTFGSAEPTAVQRLWIYRILIPVVNDIDDTIWTIPPTRFILGAEIVKEDDLPYMMRLKRSYELSTR